MTVALGPGFGLFVLPSGWFDSICETIRRRSTSDCKEGGSPDGIDELESNEMFSRQLAQEVNSSEFDLAREPTPDDDLLLTATTNTPIAASESNIERVSRSSSDASAGGGTGGGMRFISSYFASTPQRTPKSSDEELEPEVYDQDELADEFEILSAAEITDAINFNNAELHDTEINRDANYALNEDNGHELGEEDDQATIASASLGTDDEEVAVAPPIPDRPASLGSLPPPITESQSLPVSHTNSLAGATLTATPAASTTDTTAAGGSHPSSRQSSLPSLPPSHAKSVSFLETTL